MTNIQVPMWVGLLLLAVGVMDLLLARSMVAMLARHPQAATSKLKLVATVTQLSGAFALVVGLVLLLFFREGA